MSENEQRREGPSSTQVMTAARQSPPTDLPRGSERSRYFDFVIDIGERRDDGGQGGYYPVEAHLENGAVFDGGRLELDRVGLNLSALGQDAEAHGRKLSEAIFSPEIARAFYVALGYVQHPDSGYDGLRVRLSIAAEAPELHALTWERLYHQEEREWGPLATSANSPFSRYIDMQSPRPLPAVAGPVLILVVIAHPSGIPAGVLAPIDVAAEIANLQGAFAEIAAERSVQFTFMPGRSGLADEQRRALEQAGHQIVTGPASLDNIAARLRSGYDVLHFLGHGHFDQTTNTATLHLENENGGWAPVADTVVTNAFRSLRRMPRLVFLSACESATRAEHDPFVGLAPKLVRAQVAAVVAMQEAVTMDDARTLTRHFYANLFEHGLVDLALNQARSHIYQPDRLDWGIPVLFTRLTDGRLFARPSQPRPWRRIVLLACGLALAALLVPFAHARLAATGDGTGQGSTWQGDARLHRGQVDETRAQAGSWMCEAGAPFCFGHTEAALLRQGQVDEKRAQADSWMREARAQFRLGMREARARFRLGYTDAALHAYRQARMLYLEAGDKQGQGNTWIGEAQILTRLEEWGEAVAAYKQARRLFMEAGDKQGQGNTWIGQAEVVSRTDRDYLECYQMARTLFAEAGDKQGQGNTWAGEARGLFELGQYDGALAAYRQARTLYVEASDEQGQATAWMGEAWALVRLGHHDEVLHACREARALFLEVADEQGQGNTWQGEAEVLLRLGRNDAALYAYRRARALFLAVSDNQGQGNAWQGEADVLSRLGQDDAALDAYRRARSLFDVWRDHRGQHNQQDEGKTWRGEADVLSRLGQDEAARDAYSKARNRLSVLGEPRELTYTRQRLAEVLSRLGAVEAALSEAEDAVQVATAARSIAGELFARIQEARILRAGKQKPRAMQMAGEALALLRRWRQEGAADFDLVAMSGWSELYDFLISRLVRQRGPAVENALALAEEAHAPVPLDLLATGSRRDDPSSRSLREERERLQQELATLDRRLHDAIAPGERQALQHERAVVDARLELNELAILGSMASSFVNGTPIDATARAALVEEAGPILLYYVAGDETVAFLLQPGQRTPLVRRIDLPRVHLESEVRELRQALSQGSSNPSRETTAHDRQRALYDRLVAPFAHALAGKPRLTIVPHGPLYELPFEALLVDDRTLLFERWHVSIAPSLSALHALRQRRAEPEPASDEPAFPHVAGGTGQPLDAIEIAQTPLQAELVTLAASETARGEALLDDERLDLTRALLIAGAGAVLVARWQVPEDEHTRRFLRDFYQALRHGGAGGNGLRKDEALTEARRRARERSDDARLWAAWVLVGDAR